MATARQCKKVIGLDWDNWDNLEYSVADWAATGEKWRGRHKCRHTCILQIYILPNHE